MLWRRVVAAAAAISARAVRISIQRESTGTGVGLPTTGGTTSLIVTGEMALLLAAVRRMFSGLKSSLGDGLALERCQCWLFQVLDLRLVQ